MIDVNTTSANPTHFLRGVELVKRAGEEYNVPSENWPYPSEYRFGIPQDRYYSEIWVNGMDWQPSYWVIEEYQLEKPRIQPFIIFKTNEDRFRFNERDFKDLVMASLYYRRDILWMQTSIRDVPTDLGHYTDSVWPYISLIGYEEEYTKNMMLYNFEHNSQPRVEFYMNRYFVPEEYGKKNRNNRDS